jgi:hypothetical protein
MMIVFLESILQVKQNVLYHKSWIKEICQLNLSLFYKTMQLKSKLMCHICTWIFFNHAPNRTILLISIGPNLRDITKRNMRKNFVVQNNPSEKCVEKLLSKILACDVRILSITLCKYD